jgi:hypothetical protein
MRLLTKKEFAAECGMRTKDGKYVATNKLSVFIDRGQVVLDGDVIDADHEINALFLERQKAGIGKKAETILREGTGAPVTKKPKSKPAKKTTKKKQAEHKPPKKPIGRPPKQVPGVEKLPKPPKPPKESKPPAPKKPPVTRRPEVLPHDPVTEVERMVVEKLKKLSNDKLEAELRQKQLSNERAELEIQKLQGKLIPVKPVRNVILQHVVFLMQGFRKHSEKMLAELGAKYGVSPTDQAEWRKMNIDAINQLEQDARKQTVKQLEQAAESQDDSDINE